MIARIVVTAAVLATALASPGSAQDRENAPLAVVVRSDASIDSLSLGELRRIFMGDRQFAGDRNRITLFIPSPGAEGRGTAMRVIYRMREVEYRQYWVAKIFRAEVVSGPRVASAEEAKRLVVATRGALALIPAAAVDQTVKVVVVGGRRPGQAGYALQ